MAKTQDVKAKEDQTKNTAKKVDQVSDGSMKDLYGGEKEVKKTADAKKGKGAKIAYRILIKPLVTEKATHQKVENKYVFMVATTANKVEIASSIEEVYGIKPIKINIINMDGKVVRRGHITGRRKDWKKAIVTLPKGKTIEVYEGV
jgi:large subunit ribosomal protein L23